MCTSSETMASKLLVFFATFVAISSAQKLFPVSIIHLNDMHARFDESNIESNVCKSRDVCIGGYARVVTKVKELLVTKADKNPIYLNAADNYQGTLWYNMFKWNVTSYFLNLLPADAMTIGNHEFDDGIAGLVPFLETIKSPILIANVDDSQEPSFQGKYTKSMVITKYGREIGIVGVTTTMKSNWGRVNILPEVEAVRDEVAKLTADGIKIIIVLSHCGLDIDRKIAHQGGPIDIIVGGHTHSFLFSGENPPGPDRVVDSYPTIEKNEEGEDVLIVQASAYTKYLGDITLYFDEEGKVKNYEGAPIFLDHDVVQDTDILEELEPWKAVVNPIQNRVVGEIKFPFPTRGCYVKECLMGSLTADAYADQFLTFKPPNDNNTWTGATIALAIPGGIRAGLSQGEIVFGDAFTTTPFENFLHSVELQGKVIRAALEFSVEDENSLVVLQSSGLKVTYDMKRSKNSRIVSLLVLCRDCEIPKYEPIDDEKFYRVVMPSYLANGGDGFKMIPEGARNLIVGPKDIDALTGYIEKSSPISLPPLSGRINFV